MRQMFDLVARVCPKERLEIKAVHGGRPFQIELVSKHEITRLQ